MREVADNRKRNRSNVFLSATLLVQDASIAVRVRNLSERGALIECASAPPPGSKAQLVRGQLAAQGVIAWQGERQAGMEFEATVDVAAWLKGSGHPGQQRVDDAVAAIRSGQRPPSQASPSPTLLDLSRDLDLLCDRVARSSSMSIELGEELVRLEAIARHLERFASGR